MPLNAKNLGKRIRSLRKSKGYTQEDLSEIIHCSPIYLSNIENGTRTMSMDIFIDLVNSLETTANDLLIDCIDNDTAVLLGQMGNTLSDCSDYESKVISKTVVALKKALRE